MDADPTLIELLARFESALEPLFASWQPSDPKPGSVRECAVHDIALLGRHVYGLDGFGQKTERALLSEMLTLLAPPQPDMPFSYNLTLTDDALQKELNLKKEPLSSQQLLQALHALQMLDSWAATKNQGDEEAAELVSVFQELLTRLVFHDGQVSPAEDLLLHPFNVYFSRYNAGPSSATTSF
jgi:hypothetical protein